MPEDLEQMWAAIAGVGRSASSGGYFRQPFTSPETELRAWFAEQCSARGLVLEPDGNGNLLAWWGPDVVSTGSTDVVSTDVVSTGSTDVVSTVETPGVLIGSHLDSVLDGGAYDGPLGVVSSLAAIDVLRDRGVVPRRPLVVGAFAEEEGSRFGLACLGSRLATGATTPEAALALRDRDGTRLDDAMAAAGVDPALGPTDWVGRIGCFVELHVEQGRDLVDRDVAVGVASGIWPHGRYRFDFTGQANHAGTTRMEDRRDPMLSYAMTALAANKQARQVGQRATFGRVEVAPNGTNAVPSRVTGWLDARCETDEELRRMVAEIERLGVERAGRDGTELRVTVESESGAVGFDAALAERLSGLVSTGSTGERGAPVIPTMAGHDAGVLAAAGVPTGMLFVRNPTGVSHSPDEHAEWADCVAGVEALADVLEDLLG